MYTLDLLTKGQSATVAEVSASGSLKRRLLDIGLVEGTTVECVGQSPLGDPKAFLIRGAVIAIRNQDSNRIIIN